MSRLYQKYRGNFGAPVWFIRMKGARLMRETRLRQKAKVRLQMAKKLMETVRWRE